MPTCCTRGPDPRDSPRDSPHYACEMSTCIVSGRVPRSGLPASSQSISQPASQPAMGELSAQDACPANTAYWDRLFSNPRRCCCTRMGHVLRGTPTVERARLVILRRSHVRPRHWVNRLARHQIACTFISFATWRHNYVVWRLGGLPHLEFHYFVS